MNIRKCYEKAENFVLASVLESSKRYEPLFLSSRRIKELSLVYEKQKLKVNKEYLEMNKKIKMQVISIKKKVKISRDKTKKKKNKAKKDSLGLKLPQINKNLNRTLEIDVDKSLRYTKKRKSSNPCPDEYSSDISSDNSSPNLNKNEKN